MTECRYRVTVAGRIGPILRSGFTDLRVEGNPRHHVLLIPAVDNYLVSLLGLSALGQLEELRIEVDRFTAWYS